MGIARDVRDNIHRLTDMLSPGDLAKLARAPKRLRRRRERRAQLEWVSEFVRRLPTGERPDAWTALLWLVRRGDRLSVCHKPLDVTANGLFGALNGFRLGRAEGEATGQ